MPSYTNPGTRTCPRCKGTGSVPDRRSPLTVEQVDEIRQRYAAGGALMRELGDEYGVTEGAVSRIIRGGRR